MWEEVSDRRQNEIIEKIAKAIVKYELEAPGHLFLRTFMPFYYLGGTLGLMLLGVYLPGKTSDYLQVFQERKNVEQILKRVDELSVEREKEKPKGPSLIQRLKKKLGRKSKTDGESRDGK